MNKNKGFTLAETLVTLSVVGAIASLTIPSLTATYTNKQYETGLKKAYSVISDVYQKYTGVDGNNIASAFPGTDTGQTALNSFAQYLNTVSTCNGNNCWYNANVNSLDGGNSYSDTFNSIPTVEATLLDGSMIGFIDVGNQGASPFPVQAQMQLGRPVPFPQPPQQQHPCTTSAGNLTNVCGMVYIDINGATQPNIIGRDIFMFYITTSGVYPYGSNNDRYVTDCGANATFGYGCANTVLTQGMNY